jgi:hypothetical protein
MAIFRRRPNAVSAHRLTQDIELPNPPEKTRRGAPGDWMLVNPEGQVYFVPDNIFRINYEPVDDEAQAMWNSRMIAQ